MLTVSPLSQPIVHEILSYDPITFLYEYFQVQVYFYLINLSHWKSPRFPTIVLFP